jgi:hypothetical protein
MSNVATRNGSAAAPNTPSADENKTASANRTAPLKTENLKLETPCRSALPAHSKVESFINR